MMIHKTMKYPTTVVVDRIISNRAKHIETFKEATVGYEKELKQYYQVLEELMTSALVIVGGNRNDACNKRYEEIKVAYKNISELPKPESHIDDYDRAIDMLQTCAEEFVDMDGQTFDQYMRDDWQWKKAFTKTVDIYNNKR